MDADGQTIFRPRRGKNLMVGITVSVLGFVSGHDAWSKWMQLRATGVQAPPLDWMLILFAAILIPVGLMLVATAIRGVPRLEMDEHGVVLRNLFGAKAARWSSLGQFGMIAITVRGRKMNWAQAFITHGSGSSDGARLFSVADSFSVPLESIIAEMEHRRLSAGANPWVSAPPSTTMEARPIGVAGFRVPWLTLLMLAGFIGVFVLEQRLGIGPAGPGLTPSIRTLIGLGGLNRNLVFAGQWWRLLTCPWLHANLAHLLMNGLAFVLAGWALERLLGRVWMFVIFAAGALAGSGMSLLLSAPTTVSVGASGGIMAMLVALLIVSFRMPSGRAKTQIQFQAARVVIPSMIPVAHGAAALHVDYGAHFGGALLGGVLGMLLLLSWGKQSPLPGYRVSAAVLAAVMVLSFATGGLAVARWYPGFAVVAGVR